jgi:hypothetical protein
MRTDSRSHRTNGDLIPRLQQTMETSTAGRRSTSAAIRIPVAREPAIAATRIFTNPVHTVAVHRCKASKQEGEGCVAGELKSAQEAHKSS